MGGRNDRGKQEIKPSTGRKQSSKIWVLKGPFISFCFPLPRNSSHNSVNNIPHGFFSPIISFNDFSLFLPKESEIHIPVYSFNHLKIAILFYSQLGST